MSFKSIASVMSLHYNVKTSDTESGNTMKFNFLNMRFLI